MADELFTKNFMLMFLSNFLICAGFYMLMPLLPVYAVRSLSISRDEVGTVIGIFAFSAVLFRPFTGMLIDKAGRMQAYIPALILFAFCSGGYALAGGFAGLIAMRILHGMSWSGVSTANATIVADIVPAGMRGQGMGYFGLSMTIAMALGPAFGVYLMEKISYTAIFAICMCVSLAALFASSFVRPPAIKYDKSRFSFSSLYERRVFGIAVIQFFYGFSSVAVMSFATLHGMDMGINGIGCFFIVFAVFVSIVRFFGGRIIDRRGPALFIYGGLFVYMAGCVVLAAAWNLPAFLISAALTGFGSGLIMPTIMAMMMNVVPPNRRGAAGATVFSAFDTGVGGGAVAMGFAAHIAGYPGMYLFAAAVLLIPAAWFYFYEYSHYSRLLSEMKREI